MTGQASSEPTPTTSDSSVRVHHDGHVVAHADITTSDAPHSTARVTLDTPHRDAPSAARGELVDRVLDHPGVRSSDAVHVVAPLGDSEAMARLQERATNVNARAAGASSIIEADVPKPTAAEG
ncbi:MAG TPA: hypothetical protein VGC37_10475 [Friedmanniella sp.]